MRVLFAVAHHGRARRLVTVGRWLVVVVAGLVAVAGCGSGVSDGASPAGTPDPVAPEVGVVGPSEASAAEFAAGVVARLEQVAFYAADASFLDRLVVPGAGDGVARVLDARVGEVRWALATLPGETRRVWFVTAPLTVAVTGFDEAAGTASVAVWVVAVFSREDLGRPETRFSVERADLVWDTATGTWRVAGLVSGPGPAVGLAADQVPVTPAELDSTLAGHRLVELGAGLGW